MILRCLHITGIDVIEFQIFTDITAAKILYIIHYGPFNENGEWNKETRSVSDFQSLQLGTRERATDRRLDIISLQRTALPLHLAFQSMTYTTSDEECGKSETVWQYPYNKNFFLHGGRKNQTAEKSWQILLFSCVEANASFINLSDNNYPLASSRKWSLLKYFQLKWFMFAAYSFRNSSLTSFGAWFWTEQVTGSTRIRG